MNQTWKLVVAGLIFGVLNPAWAHDTKPAKAVRADVPAEGTQSVSSVSSVAGGNAGSAAAAASDARQADTGQTPCAEEPAPAPESANTTTTTTNTGPGRISTNVTVPKQTQGATFGEKVNAGLHAAGGSLAQAAPVVGGISGGAVAGRCAKPVKTAATEPPTATETPSATEK